MNCCDNKNIACKDGKTFVLIVVLFMIIDMLMKYLLEITI